MNYKCTNILQFQARKYSEFIVDKIPHNITKKRKNII